MENKSAQVLEISRFPSLVDDEPDYLENSPLLYTVTVYSIII